MKLLAACLIFSSLPFLVVADELQTESDIQFIITSQLTALLNGDGPAAWQYAHASIQTQFQNPERFMQMVERGYSPLMSFAQLEFISLELYDGVWLQSVRLQDTEGDWYDIIYALLETDDGYRIAGVSLQNAPGI